VCRLVRRRPLPPSLIWKFRIAWNIRATSGECFVSAVCEVSKIFCWPGIEPGKWAACGPCWPAENTFKLSGLVGALAVGMIAIN
jgi:hypothetical protein